MSPARARRVRRPGVQLDVRTTRRLLSQKRAIARHWRQPSVGVETPRIPVSEACRERAASRISDMHRFCDELSVQNRTDLPATLPWRAHAGWPRTSSTPRRPARPAARARRPPYGPTAPRRGAVPPRRRRRARRLHVHPAPRPARRYSCARRGDLGGFAAQSWPLIAKPVASAELGSLKADAERAREMFRGSSQLPENDRGHSAPAFREPNRRQSSGHG